MSAKQLLDLDTIMAAYNTAELLVGKAWRIVSAPTGSVEAARIVVPEDGTVGAP